MKYHNIAGVVFAFNRPDYLSKTLRHLEANTEAKALTWYAFLDGAVNLVSGKRYSKDAKVAVCRELLDNSPLNFHVTQNEYNECIALQKEKAHQLYADHDCIMFFEDDLIVSRHYIRLLRVALEQFPDYTILLNKDKNSGKLNQLTYCNIARIWGYGMSRNLYYKLSKRYTQYANFMKNYDYIQRNNYKGIRRRLQKTGVNWHSHDINITRLSREFGSGKLWSTITRGRYIGRKGAIAFRTDDVWRRKGLHKQPANFQYPQDAKLAKFVLRS